MRKGSIIPPTFFLITLALSLVLPKDAPRAFTHGAAISAPAQAVAYGATSLFIYDDFTSSSTTDTTNSFVPGFNWYNFNASISTWMGSPYSQPAAVYNTDYTISGSNFTIINANSGHTAGGEFGSGYFDSGSQTLKNTLPLVPGNKPFYCEANISYGSASGGIMWLQDQSSLLRSILNTGNNTLLAELDVGEGKNQSNAHGWTGPSTDPTGYSNNIASPPANGTMNKWGVLGVPRAYNSGTGIYVYYLNGSIVSAGGSWTTGSLGTGEDIGLENSNLQVMFSQTGSGSPNRIYDYIACWVHP